MIDFILKPKPQVAKLVLPVPPPVKPPAVEGLVDDFDVWLSDDDGKILTP